MPGLPDGVGMYYDVEPQHDERYFRAMVNEATKLRREFTQAYQTATSLGDRESKIAANELRALLENRKGEILDRKSFFPQEIQEKITTQVEKIQFILDKNPPFDTRPAIVTPALTNEPHNPQPLSFSGPTCRHCSDQTSIRSQITSSVPDCRWFPLIRTIINTSREQ